MDFNIGEYIVYCSKEICRIESIVKKCFNGIDENEYFKLIPIGVKNSSYYIPCNNCDSKIRKLLSKEEIYHLIEEMAYAESDWCEDKNMRKNLFNSVLKSDDYHRLISMMHSLYIQQENQRSKGKKLLAADERAMHDAEHLIHQEFAFVLGIEENQVEDFIKQNIKTTKKGAV
ncbi:CarD family transcriptional regulator [Porcipelethomonas sp.]|uniref:CarD family transcriptional regulator n=1 Tax=Porcipelethomonas sp. TaxID=2981675 RepID=UPI003EF9934E